MEGTTLFPGTIAFPPEVARRVIAAECSAGGWVLDPFAGYGTTLLVAEAMGRHGIGFETDPARADLAARGLAAPSRVIGQSCEEAARHDLPPFDLVLTSPPYPPVDLADDIWGDDYFPFLHRCIGAACAVSKPGAAVVVEVSNIRTNAGFRPLVWQVMQLLSQQIAFLGDEVRCNAGPHDAGPGVDHSHLLYFRNTAPVRGAGWDMGNWGQA